MSATDGFTDLPYSDYPGVDSDERYIYRNIKIDDVPYINTYETLLAAVMSASTDTARTNAWNEFEEFKTTADYTNHVDPILLDAHKFQRLEDCILACQRLAKRQAQQWVINDTEPDDSAQAVNDIWFQPKGSTSGITNYLMFHKTSTGYVEMALTNNIITELLNRVTALEKRLNALTMDVDVIDAVAVLPSDAASNKRTLYLVTE